MEWKPGTYLFLDDALIESATNVLRRIERPARDLKGPIVTGKEDRCFQPYLTVLQDKRSGRFRMWYNVPQGVGVGFIESDDGVNWIRPYRLLDTLPETTFGTSLVDDGPKARDLSARFKFYGWHKGMRTAHSADGLRWIAEPKEPVITNMNDILHVAWDPARNRYIALVGFPSSKEDGYVGHTQNSPEGYRRCVGESFSADGVKWEPAHRIFAPDKQDEGITEFYSIGGVVARGPLLIGLLKVLRDDLPCDENGKVDGVGYTVLVWSYDGEHWQRDREPFFDRDHTAGSWDHAMAWMDYQLPVGDQVYIYYGGYAHGHKVERYTERQIGLVRIKSNRYVARESDEGGGKLRTREFALNGGQLFLNAAAAKGEIAVQVEDEKGRPYRGFSFRDCKEVQTDSVKAVVRWKKSLGSLRGKVVRFNIALKNARLYGVEIAAER